MQNKSSAAPVLPGLSERAIRAAGDGAVIWDKDVKGLHFRVRGASRGFFLCYRARTGEQRRPKLGAYGAITLTQARQAAREMLAQLALGRDPMQERAKARGERTFGDLWREYEARHVGGLKSAAEVRAIYRRYLEKPLQNKRLSAITFETIHDLATGMRATPIAANRALATLSGAFAFAQHKLRWTTSNPCVGVPRAKEEKRRRYLTADEAQRVAAALDALEPQYPAHIAFIRLLILTGARLGEIAAARWEWLDGDVLRLPDSKTGAKAIHLAPAAMAVLEALPRTSGTLTGVTTPQKIWEKVKERAGCEDVRLHDLRHSFASAALGAGLSLAQIGELLGHRNPATTHRYAHLVEEAAAVAARTATAAVVARMGATPPAQHPES